MSITPSPSSVRDHDADDAPRLLWLGDARAADASLTGAKAANLAVARAADLPVLDGFVLTVLIVVAIGTIYYGIRLVKELRRSTRR